MYESGMSTGERAPTGDVNRSCGCHHTFESIPLRRSGLAWLNEMSKVVLYNSCGVITIVVQACELLRAHAMPMLMLRKQLVSYAVDGQHQSDSCANEC